MKKIFLSMTLGLALFCGYSYAHAQTQQVAPFCTGGSCTYVPLEPLPGLPNCYGAANNANGPIAAGCQNPQSFASLVGDSFKLLIGAGGVIAVVMIVIGALTYMFSDVIGNKSKALSRIRGAMWAIVLLVSSYLILNTINPELVNFNLNLNPAAPVQGVTAGTTGSLSGTAPSALSAPLPNNTVTTGTMNTAIDSAICGTTSGPGVDCPTYKSYILYDPNANTVQAQIDKNNFFTSCETGFVDQQRPSGSAPGAVKIFSGSIAGSPGLTGAACVYQ